MYHYFITLCENFADLYSLKFSTNVNVEKSKTKCLVFSSDNMNINDVSPIILNGVPLPYVSEIKHVGNILQSNNSMKKDISVKRAQFISKVHSLNQEFHFSNPSFVMKLYNIYACSFHGSSLWDLYSDNVNKLFTSWNISIRILFDIPRNTHRYLIEPISDCFHVKTLLCSRLISFYESLCKSVKPCIRLMTEPE